MTATAPAAPSVIPTFYVGDDEVILLPDGRTALVSSKSEPGKWREVDAENHLCICPGYQYRGHCRHVDAVKAAEELDRSTVIPFPVPEPPAPTFRRASHPMAPSLPTCISCHQVEMAREGQSCNACKAKADTCSCGNPWTLRIEGSVYCAECAPSPTAYHFMDGVACWNWSPSRAMPKVAASIERVTDIPRGFLR